jgi:putative colanic acid biosysnthesis UDP-glucose lipid carrier transferase
MKNFRSLKRFLRQISDILILGTAFVFASVFGHKSLEPNQFLIITILIFTWYFTSKYTNLYDDFRTSRFVSEIIILVPNIITQLISVGFIYFVLNDHAHVRTFTIIYIGLASILLLINKYLFKKWKLYNWLAGNDVRNLLIIGGGEQGQAFFEMTTRSKQYGYNPIGYVDDFQTNNLDGKLKGKLVDVEKIIADYDVHEMIISQNQYDMDSIKSLMAVADKFAVRTRIIPDFFQLYSSKFKLDTFGQFPIINVRDEPLEEFHWYLLKAVFDRLFSLILFVFIFSWLFPLIAIAVKLDSKGSIFYKQERWGKNGKSFSCYKFRTMFQNAETTKTNGKFSQTLKNDARITPLGKFLRRTNFDELPQFWNVLLGEMSVVGPRPHAVQHSIESNQQIENYLLRHLIKPGITGWAQVNGYRGETNNVFAMKKRVDFDIWYIENWSIWLDIKVIIMTIYAMIKGDVMAY